MQRRAQRLFLEQLLNEPTLIHTSYLGNDLFMRNQNIRKMILIRYLEKLYIVRIFDFSTILTAIVYPISTHWCWGDGGWLNSRGFYDFAGSGVVHVSGGVHALVGNITNYNARTYVLYATIEYFHTSILATRYSF